MVEHKTLPARNDWEDQQRGADISVSLANGDVFGARAGVYTERMRSASGTVEVYKNGNLVGTRDVSGWSYSANGGYIGLWTVGGNGTYYDDPSTALRTGFGGGDLPTSYQPGGSKVLAAYHPEPAVRVKAAPRQYVRPRSMLTLSRDPGVVWRSYYFAGTARIAMREESDAGSEVYYILTDHLGSTSVTYRASDGMTATQKYKPWGEVRQVVGEMPTDYTFTGQRDAGWGLYHFKARWFDSALGRFTQADTIVPGAGNPLAWDRYAGLGNNPVRYTDPSGHRPACEDTDDPACAEVLYTLDEIAGQYGITFDGSWTRKEKAVILTGAYFIGKATNRVLTKPLSYASAFRKAHGNKTQFYKSTSAGSTCGAGTDTVTCDSGVALTPQLVAHELGHVFSWEYGGDPYEDLGNAALMDNEDNWITGTHPGGDFERTTSGYKGEGPPYMYHGPIEWDDWNSNTNNTARNEDYADMYMNWVFDTFDYSGTSLGAGKVRYDWMTTNVAEYVGR